MVWTILLLAADSVIGSLLLRSQGRAAWRRFNEALAQGRMPHQEVQDGVLVDLRRRLPDHARVHLRCAWPAAAPAPTRSLIRRWGVKAVGRRMAIRVAAPRGHDVEGTATEHHAPPGQLER